MTKDVSDTHKMVHYLSSINPFTDKPELYSLASGVTADESVDGDWRNSFQNIIGKK